MSSLCIKWLKRFVFRLFEGYIEALKMKVNQRVANG